jgi:CBS domain containing-hemolysin-like protein
MEIEIGITVLLLVALAFLATVDLAFGQLSDVGLRRLNAEAEEQPAAPATTFLREVLEDRPRFRYTISAANQILLVAVSVLIASVVSRLGFAHFILIAFIASIALAFVCRQFIPRLVSLRNPDKTLLSILPVFQPFYRVITYLAVPWHRLSDRFRPTENRIEAGADDDEEDGDTDHLQALIDVGEKEGILEEEEGELIHSIVEFGDTTVNEVMTPRTEIVALSATATVRGARSDCRIKYSRLPVYREQIDNVEGIVYVRDLLQCWSEDSACDTIAPLLRPAYFVPETKHVSELLTEMQRRACSLRW